MSGFRADIQGLRGIAVVVVVAYHADVFLSGGYIGVDVFFVVSGFVITRLIAAELSSSGRLRFGHFYLRRIRRLLPALATMLVFVTVAGVALAPIDAQVTTAQTAIAAATVNANHFLLTVTNSGYFDPGAEANPLLHTWSLSLEEQFYLVFPALVAGVWAVGRRTKREPEAVVLAVLSAVIGVSFMASGALTGEVFDDSRLDSRLAFYSAPTRAWEFAVGGAVALAFICRPHEYSGRSREAMSVIGLALITAGCLAFDDSTRFPGVAALVPVLGAALLIVGGTGSGSIFTNRVIGTGPLRVLGDISYSWYLWHWPAIVFAVAMWPGASVVKPAAAVISLVPAWLSYRLVEQPIRVGVMPPRRSTLRIAAVSVLVPVTLAPLLIAANAYLEKDSELLAPFANHACDLAEAVVGDGEQSCIWPVSADGSRAVLIGDSNAWHFTEGFVDAANSRGLDAVVATHSACPFVDIRIPVPVADEDGADCERFKSRWMDELVGDPAEIVVLAASSAVYIEDDGVSIRSSDGQATFDTPAAKKEAWEHGLRRQIEPLAAAGTRVYVVHRAPVVEPRFAPGAQSALSLMLGRGEIRFDRDRALRYRERSASAERSATAGLAETIDPFPVLCPEDPCRTQRNGAWLYLDWGHLSIDGAEILGEAFRQAFDRDR